MAAAGTAAAGGKEAAAEEAEEAATGGEEVEEEDEVVAVLEWYRRVHARSRTASRWCCGNDTVLGATELFGTVICVLYVHALYVHTV